MPVGLVNEYVESCTKVKGICVSALALSGIVADKVCDKVLK